MIYGLTGLLGAGKGTVARIISREQRCRAWLMSDELRAMMRKRGLKTTRKGMQDFAVETRRVKGEGFVAELLAKKIRSRNAVVDGMRNTAEVRALRKRFGRRFRLLAVSAPLRVRFGRARKRSREAEARTLSAFRKSDRREAKSEGFGVRACMRAADYKIDNGGSLAALRKRVLSILERDRVLQH